MRRRILCCLLFVLLVVGAAVPAFAAGEKLSALVEIEPQYEAVRAFWGDRAPAKLDGKWGLIDAYGETVVPFIYSWMGAPSDGVVLAAKQTDGGDHRLFLVSAESGAARKLTYAFFDGQQETDMTATDEQLAVSGHHFVCYDGVINVRGIAYLRDGEQIRPQGLAEALGGAVVTHYAMTGPSVAGVIPMAAYVQGSDGVTYTQCFYMNHHGEIIRIFPAVLAGLQLTGVYAPQDGLIVAETTRTLETGTEIRYGLMDQEGEWIVLPIYTDFRWTLDGTFFHDGLWIVVDGGKYGAIDREGNRVIPFAYDFMGVFSAGLCGASRNGEMFYLDTAGRSYTVEGPDGGVAELGAASTFNGEGIACVYDRKSGRAYCISAEAKNGALPAIKDGPEIARAVYFPDYTEGEPCLGLTYEPGELMAYAEDGKWGFLRYGELLHFDDVAEDAYYAEPVDWAVRRSITNGTSPTTFSPESDCTKAQIITFLWRASGSPTPISRKNPFRDVAEGQYYTDAVLWALEEGIVPAGERFGPNDPCTRGQTVVFMWRCAGSPETEGGNAFSDVTPGSETERAVRWAVAQEITNGTTAVTFSPYRVCTRGQIVTFLWRAYAK
ncbi:MAG: WG repeat-containing protein [Clostridia bacterium]|nr:WG repeat-containing protein [Clostridia bacterium]